MSYNGHDIPLFELLLVYTQEQQPTRAEYEQAQPIKGSHSFHKIYCDVVCLSIYPWALGSFLCSVVHYLRSNFKIQKSTRAHWLQPDFKLHQKVSPPSNPSVTLCLVDDEMTSNDNLHFQNLL